MQKGKKHLAGRESGKRLRRLDPAKDFNEPVKRPKQSRLPGMEDPAIQELEDAAIEHSQRHRPQAARRRNGQRESEAPRQRCEQRINRARFGERNPPK